MPRTRRTKPDTDRLWSTAETSAYLGIAISTLYEWRAYGLGPRSYRIGRHARYDPADVKRWLATRTA